MTGWFFVLCVFFVFKQKTAYEMRISDWSSDVCSSDLEVRHSGGLSLLRRTRALMLVVPGQPAVTMAGAILAPLLMAGSAATRTMAPRDGRTAGLAGVRAAAARAALPALPHAAWMVSPRLSQSGMGRPSCVKPPEIGRAHV